MSLLSLALGIFFSLEDQNKYKWLFRLKGIACTSCVIDKQVKLL